MQEPAGGPSAVGKPGGETALLVNTKSRRGRSAFMAVQDALRERGVRVSTAHAVPHPHALPELAERCLNSGATTLLVAGGDGTFRSVAGAIARAGAVLGVIPLGTVNDLARNLGIPPALNAACDVISGGQVAAIDLGLANDDYFVITASLGFSAQMQAALTPNLKRLLGPCGYLVAGLAAVRKMRPFRVTVTSERGPESLEAVQVGTVNGHSWLGGSCEIPGVGLESGRLAFYAVPPQTGFATARLARDLFRCRFFHSPNLLAFTTQDALVETGSAAPLVLDGDLCGHAPVRFRVIENALQVLVPADFQK